MIKTQKFWTHHYINHEQRWEWGLVDDTYPCRFERFSAPSMAELWAIMPKGTLLTKGANITAAWLVNRESQSDDDQNANPADSLGELAIWLKERGKR